MTDWIWSKADEKGLVRFAHPDAVLTAAAERHVDLGIERLAAEQTVDGRRTIARAIYEGLQHLDPPIDYDRERYLHHGEYRQIIRTPRQILITEKHGTCLDLALLFCAFALSQDLMPLLVIVEGHAFAAVSLMHGRQQWEARPRDELTRFVDGGGLVRDGEALLRLIEKGWYLPIECTGFARSRALAATAGPEGESRDAAGFLAFDRAVDAGLEQLCAAARRFCYVLDVHLLQQELGFGTYAPPDLLTQAQPEHQLAELPAETLPILAREILKHAPGLGERDRRDSLVEKLRRLTNARFPLRVDDAEVDLIYVLVGAFRNATIAAALRTVLREFLADQTKYLHILATIDGLRSLSSLKPLLARQEIDLPAVQRLYRASIADPKRAQPVASLDDVLIALLESEPRTAGGVRPLIEFVERLARQTANAELRNWVDEHAGDAARLSELRGSLDGEEPRPGGFDYLLIDVPSERPDRIEYWRYDRSGHRLAGDILTSDSGAPLDARRAVERIIAIAKADDAELRIEVFVPARMLNSDPEHCRVAQFGAELPVGDLHPVHLRWRERARDKTKTALRERWYRLAAEIRQQNHGSACWLDDPELYPPVLKDRLERRSLLGCLGFRFIPFDAGTRAPHPLLQVALSAGMAFGIWQRRAPEDWQSFRERIEELIAGRALDDVPLRVKSARANRQVRHLTLFWDDPERNPWGDDHEQLQSPEQRGQT